MMMTMKMESHLLNHYHPVRGMLLPGLLLHPLQNHLQNRSPHDPPSLFAFGRVDGYLYYSPLTSSRKIRVPTLIAVSLNINHLTHSGDKQIETSPMLSVSLEHSFCEVNRLCTISNK